tara:strand:+ start:2239 stop:2514 length:276 start_codon:yes stop_codon:yes gene_type:complete
MPKKAKKKGKKKATAKRGETYAYVKPRRIATAGQLNQVHNQSLKNSQRDSAELSRLATAEREKQKTEMLVMEKAVLERRFQQLNPFIADDV